MLGTVNIAWKSRQNAKNVPDVGVVISDDIGDDVWRWNAFRPLGGDKHAFLKK